MEKLLGTVGKMKQEVLGWLAGHVGTSFQPVLDLKVETNDFLYFIP